LFACAHLQSFIPAAPAWNSRVRRGFTAAHDNDAPTEKLSPSCPQDFVDKLCINFRVGALQREQIQQWRGFPGGAFGYNEGPTSSCHTFCWKARHSFDVPFF
jgi:hypothetical protein